MILLAIAVIVMRPEIHMPALTRFVDGSGPIFGGALFPFVFIAGLPVPPSSEAPVQIVVKI